MKQVKRSIVLLALAFTLLLVPAGMAQPNKPLRCGVSFELNWTWEGFKEEPGYPWSLPIVDGTWVGTVSGDIEGDATLTLIGASFPGITEHYSEEWVIVNTDASITIYQKGVWSFKSFKFKSNGYVTAATGDWAYLLGSRVHVRGVTTEFPVDPPMPVSGEGTMWICGYAA